MLLATANVFFAYSGPETPTAAVAQVNTVVPSCAVAFTAVFVLLFYAAMVLRRTDCTHCRVCTAQVMLGRRQQTSYGDTS